MNFNVKTTVKYRSKKSRLITYQTEDQRDFALPGKYGTEYLKKFLLLTIKNELKDLGFILTGTQLTCVNYPSVKCVVNFDNGTERGTVVRELIFV